MTLNLTLIKEEQPFLVAGISAFTKEPVFGFPYFHKVRLSDDSSECCPCIILPTADDGVGLPDDGPYAFACRTGEFHVISGPLHKFLYEDEDGRYHFEDGIIFNTDNQ